MGAAAVAMKMQRSRPSLARIFPNTSLGKKEYEKDMRYRYQAAMACTNKVLDKHRSALISTETIDKPAYTQEGCY
jgi:hypothetical protein